MGRFRIDNPMTRAEISRRYYEKHKADCIRRTSEWKRRNGIYSNAKTKLAKRMWYTDNKGRLSVLQKEARREASRKYRRSHADIVRANSRAYMRDVDTITKRRWAENYRVRNRERLRAKARRAYREQPKRRAACKANAYHRKLLLRGLSVVTETINRLEVFKRDRGLCHICGALASMEEFHIDHIIPISKGGTHSLKNVAVSHPHCNRRKGSRLIWR